MNYKKGNLPCLQGGVDFVKQVTERVKKISLFLCLLLLLTACTELPPDTAMSAQTAQPAASVEETAVSMEHLPPYADCPWVAINNNIPEFDESLFTTESSEFYNELDQLGRCGACFANIGQDLMPTEPRGSIREVHPSGWWQESYDFVEGGVLYNRCHLIGFQLTGENANDHNLITGTRYLNTEGMLPFEEMVAKYIKTTGNHVLYRVTPVFEGSDLVAKGVHMEAMSVEDRGEGVCFNVYCYNVQPGVTIDYATGESRLSSVQAPSEETADTYVLNTLRRKFHLPDCASVTQMNENNREDYTGSREDLIAGGYEPCGRCKP